MDTSRLVRMVATAAVLVALTGPLPVSAGSTDPEACPRYVDALMLAREALEKGDRTQSVVLLKRAKSELELCQHRSEKPGEKLLG
jgi:hypothetical protein